MALAEKDIPWEGHYIDILKGDQFAPDFLKLNPKGLVPVLIDNGKVILESTVINEYIEDAYPDIPLRPTSALDCAQMRFWTKLIDEQLYRACAVITFSVFHRHIILKLNEQELTNYLEAMPSPELREKKKGWILKGVEASDAQDAFKAYFNSLNELDKALDGNDWSAGTSFSLADIAWAPYVNRMAMLGMTGMCTTRVTEWFDRMKARDSFKPAVLDWIPPEMTADMKF
jgi:glutathione S-transferase